jgi:hypothetical protein
VGLCKRVRAIPPLRTLSVRRLTTAVGKTLVIWMDRISDGRLADTNALFIPPVTADGTPRYWPEQILGRLPGFDPRRPSALFVRGYQPFHEGHRRPIEEGIRRVDQAGIAARDTRGVGYSNPLSLFDVKPRIDHAMRWFWAHIRLSGCLTYAGPLRAAQDTRLTISDRPKEFEATAASCERAQAQD